MRFTTYSKYKGRWLDALNLESLGLRPGQVVGQSVYELYRDRPEVVADIRRVLSGETITTIFHVGGAALESRGALWDIAGKTGDPPRALENLLERDRMFTDRLRREAEEAGPPLPLQLPKRLVHVGIQEAIDLIA